MSRIFGLKIQEIELPQPLKCNLSVTISVTLIDKTVVS